MYLNESAGLEGVVERKLNEAVFSCADVCCYFQGQGWMYTVFHSPGAPGCHVGEWKPLDGAGGNQNLMSFVSLCLFHVFIAREVG